MYCTYISIYNIYINTSVCTPCSSQVKCSDTTLNAAQEKTALTHLSSLLQHLNSELPQHTVKEYRQLLRQPEKLRALHTRGREVMRELFGFSLEVCGSQLEGGGRGVVVREGGVPSGHLVGLYPGTLVFVIFVIQASACWHMV